MPKNKLAPVLKRNIQALHERRRAEHDAADASQRLARRIAAVIGTMAFAYTHAAVLGAWIVIQLGLTPLRPFDPHFTAMISVASVECVFMTIFVLINQRIEARAADRRADLDVQISLLTEHELTRVITMVHAIADKLGVDCQDEEIEHLEKDVAPEEVLDELAARDEAPG
jgi:uncharacterized membrane protein